MKVRQVREVHGFHDMIVGLPLFVIESRHVQLRIRLTGGLFVLLQGIGDGGRRPVSMYAFMWWWCGEAFVSDWMGAGGQNIYVDHLAHEIVVL